MVALPEDDSLLAKAEAVKTHQQTLLSRVQVVTGASDRGTDGPEWCACLWAHNMPTTPSSAGTAVRAATTLSAITNFPTAFVRLDPPGACDACAALQPIFDAAAVQLGGRVGVFTVQCGAHLRLCDSIAKPRPAQGPIFAVWSSYKFHRYRGARDAESLVQFLKSFAQEPDVADTDGYAGGSGSDASTSPDAEDEALDGQALLRLGLRDFSSQDRAVADRAVARLERAHAKGAVDVDTPHGSHEWRQPKAIGQKHGLAPGIHSLFRLCQQPQLLQTVLVEATLGKE